METVQQEGNRTVKRSVVMYSLDAIITVGYRVNSIRAIELLMTNQFVGITDKLQVPANT